MPGYDGTGPQGQGPATEGGQGGCTPGKAVRSTGQGLGQGMGQGMGRGNGCNRPGRGKGNRNGQGTGRRQGLGQKNR